MVRHFHNETPYKFTWDQVARAFWRRYPNPYASHVLSEDVVERYVNEDGNLYTKRLLKKESRPPKWGERFISATQVYIIEESIIDPTHHIIDSYTRNIGLQRYMTIDEKVIYKPCSENPLTTVAYRDAWIDSNFYGLSKAVQAFGYERFKHNVKKATKGFQYVLEQIYHDPTSIAEQPFTALQREIRDSLKDQAKRASTELAEFAKTRQIRVPPAASVHKSPQ